MSGTNTRNKSLWYGYLEAGDKSSPVLNDESMDTGNPKTRYLFNLARNEFVEYRRDIVDAKLRELKNGEESVIETLQQAYDSARPRFKPHSTLVIKSDPAPAESTTKAGGKLAESASEDDDEPADFDDDWTDDDED